MMTFQFTYPLYIPFVHNIISIKVMSVSYDILYFIYIYMHAEFPLDQIEPQIHDKINIVRLYGGRLANMLIRTPW